MAILTQLGINHTVFLQLGIFLIVITFLSIVAFRPYLAAVESREKKTKGGEKQAAEYKQKTEDLAQRYENKARGINNEIKTIFDTYREEANKESEVVIEGARKESLRLIEETRKIIGHEIQEAVRKIKEEAPEVANLITNKVLAKGAGAKK